MLINKIIFLGFFYMGVFFTHGQSSQIQLANDYFQQGEFEKAKIIYAELVRHKQNFFSVHTNYIEVLKKLGEKKEIIRYFSQVKKWYPSHITYQVEEITLFFDWNDQKRYSRGIDRLKKQYGNNHFQLSIIGRQFANKRMYQQAIDFFLIARQVSKTPSNYALELARVYGLANEKYKMMDEYIIYSKAGKQQLTYIKSILQNFIKEEYNLLHLEKVLIQRMQKDPTERIYPDLMIWVELQRENFYGAFLQARALDKREQTNGNQTLRVGRIAMDNKSWDDAITIFTYLTKMYHETLSQSYYRKQLIESKEGKIKYTFPIDRTAIKNLSKEYQVLYEELGPNNYTLEALLNKAHLHAFYLDEIDTAAIILRHLIASPLVTKKLASQSKLDLGDIYLLKNTPWEATLLYSQVEKAHQDSPLAYEAKFKNARLHYFTGNFSLAKSHLDILKQATTRKISNDAIDLATLIANNTFLDSTDVVMQKFASIELMIFQNQTAQAEQALMQMLVQNKGHAISDEIYWELARLHIQSGKFHAAITYLEKITQEYSFDILADDAAFSIAEITDKNLNDTVVAKDLYQKFIITYPGSMYAAEARNRFRKLRGDFRT